MIKYRVIEVFDGQVDESEDFNGLERARAFLAERIHDLGAEGFRVIRQSEDVAVLRAFEKDFHTNYALDECDYVQVTLSIADVVPLVTYEVRDRKHLAELLGVPYGSALEALEADTCEARNYECCDGPSDRAPASCTVHSR